MSNSALHIVFLSPEYPVWASGGVGTFIQTFGRALVSRGHKVSVVGPGTDLQEQVLEDQGVGLYRLAKNKSKLPNFMHNARQINKKLKQLNKEHPINIIEASELGLALLSGSHTAKRVIRLHGGHHFFSEAEQRGINWRKGFLEKRSFKKADGFIAVTNYVKEHTAKYLSYGNAKLTIINYPMNTGVTVPKVHVDANSILFAGTVCEKKGVRQLIQGFKIVRQKYPEVCLDIYGRDWFYPDGRSYIEQIKKDLDAQYFTQVSFKGVVPRAELDMLYAQAAVCVFPSHMETQGLVSLEAMLLERPVVFSKYGPGPETITHGDNGLLCDVYNPEDIAKQILWIIENEQEANAMGKRARKDVIAKYDLDKIVAQNLDFYRSL